MNKTENNVAIRFICKKANEHSDRFHFFKKNQERRTAKNNRKYTNEQQKTEKEKSRLSTCFDWINRISNFIFGVVHYET